LEFSKHAKKATLSHIRFYEAQHKSLSRENETLKQRIRMLSKAAQLNFEGTLLLHYQEKISFLNELVRHKEGIIRELREKEHWRKCIGKLAQNGSVQKSDGTTNRISKAKRVTRGPGVTARNRPSALSPEQVHERIDHFRGTIKNLRKHLQVVGEGIELMELRKTVLVKTQNSIVDHSEAAATGEWAQISQETGLHEHRLIEIGKQAAKYAREVCDLQFLVQKTSPQASLTHLLDPPPGSHVLGPDPSLWARGELEALSSIFREGLALRSTARACRVRLTKKDNKKSISRKYKFLKLDPTRLISKVESTFEKTEAEKVPSDLHGTLEVLLQNSQEIKRVNALIEYAMQENRELTSQNRAQVVRLIDQERELEAEKSILLELSEEIADLRHQAGITEAELAEKRKLIKIKEEKIIRLKQMKKALEAENKELNDKIDENDAKITELIDRIQVLNKENSDLHDQLIAQNESLIKIIDESVDSKQRLGNATVEQKALKQLVEVLEEKTSHKEIELKRLRHQLTENELARKELLFAFERNVSNRTVHEKLWQTVTGRKLTEKRELATSLTDIGHRMGQLQVDDLKMQLKESLRQLQQERVRSDELRKKLTKAETIDKVILQQNVKKLKQELVSVKERPSERGKSISNTTDAFSPTQHDSDSKRTHPIHFSALGSLRQIPLKRCVTDKQPFGNKKSDNLKPKQF
jgi:hypothetical protein